MDGLVLVLTIITALGCGLNAGVFYAFSSFVMPGLEKAGPPTGIRAMQGINVTAPMAPFMVVFLGTALLSVAVAVAGFASLGDDWAIYLIVAGLLYLFTAIGLTGGYHVPRNNALDAVDPDSRDGQQYWARYLVEWTRVNHVRAAGPLAAAALLTVAIHVG